MTCPKCGGARWENLGGGRAKCITNVEEFGWGTAPGEVRSRISPCEHEYAAPSAANGVCFCGNFAVRQCTVCGMALCGDLGHSSKVEGRWMCPKHSSDATAEHEEAERRRRAQEEDEQQAERRAWQADYATSTPRGTFEDLVEYLLGYSSVRDGQTHNFSVFTLAGLATAVEEALRKNRVRFSGFLDVEGGGVNARGQWCRHVRNEDGPHETLIAIHEPVAGSEKRTLPEQSRTRLPSGELSLLREVKDYVKGMSAGAQDWQRIKRRWWQL